MKQFIGCWTGKVHTGEISRLSWSWGRWGARTGPRFSGFLGSAFLCVGLMLRLAAFKVERWQSAVPGLHAFSSHCGGEGRFLSPNHPAECWALLWLDGQPTQVTGMEHSSECGWHTLQQWRNGFLGGSWDGKATAACGKHRTVVKHTMQSFGSAWGIPTFDVIFVSFFPCIKEVTWLAPLRSPLSYYTLVIIASTHLLSTSYVCAGFALSTLLISINLRTGHCGKNNSNSYFADGETEA